MLLSSSLGCIAWPNILRSQQPGDKGNKQRKKALAFFLKSLPRFMTRNTIMIVLSLVACSLVMILSRLRIASSKI